jgi:hypothetical protein
MIHRKEIYMGAGTFYAGMMVDKRAMRKITI